jgi:hypothetical protein
MMDDDDDIEVTVVDLSAEALEAAELANRALEAGRAAILVELARMRIGSRSNPNEPIRRLHYP